MAMNAQLSNNDGDDFLPSVGGVLNQLVPQKAGVNAPPQFVTSSIRQTILAYHMPPNATTRELRAVMTALTLCGRCGDVRPAAWQSLVLTWSFVCFPELMQQCKADPTSVDYEYQQFPPDFVQSCIDSILQQGDESTAGDAFITFPQGLPNANTVPLNIDLVDSERLKGCMPITQ